MLDRDYDPARSPADGRKPRRRANQRSERASITLICGVLEHLRRTGARITNYGPATRTGFGIVARIESVDPDSISFSGEGPFDRRAPKFGTVAVAGTLNRRTGAASVLEAVFSGSGLSKEIVLRVSYICKVI